jgi:hypothetical protein
VLALAGCGFQTQGDGDLAIPDGAVSDGALSDGAPDLTGGAPDLAGDAAVALNCPLPLLLVTVADQGPGAGTNGEVLAYHLDSGGTVHACAPHTASSSTGIGELYKPYAAAFIPPDAIAVTDDRVSTLFMLGANTDDIRWKYVYATGAQSFGGHDVFPIAHNGQTLVGVARSTAGAISMVRDRLDLFHDGSMIDFIWKLDGTQQPVSNVAATCASLLDPGRFFAVQNQMPIEAAYDVDPFATSATPYAAYPNGATLSTVQAVRVFGVNRTAWVDTSVGKIWWANDTGGTPSLMGPLGCSSGCTLVDAAPDPSDTASFYGVCNFTTSTPHTDVVYLASTGTCTTIVDGTALLASALQVNRVAVAAP